jgi:thiamine biosynthesis protein ThiC
VTIREGKLMLENGLRPGSIADADGQAQFGGRLACELR